MIALTDSDVATELASAVSVTFEPWVPKNNTVPDGIATPVAVVRLIVVAPILCEPLAVRVYLEPESR